MKQIIIIPILILLTALFSGCLLEEYIIDEDFTILQEDGNIYQQDDPLPGLTFRIPQVVLDDVTSNAVRIEAEVILPDETSEGLYTETFLFPITENDDLFIDTYAITLYFPGNWIVDYDIFDGDAETPLLEGMGGFYVEDDDVSLAVFEVIEWECPANTSFADSFYVNFTIKNTGMESGEVALRLINTDLEGSAATIYKFGYEFWSDTVTLQDDEELSESIYIPTPENNMEITLIYNGNQKSQSVEVIDTPETHPEVEPIQFDVFLGIFIAVIFGMFIVFLLKGG